MEIRVAERGRCRRVVDPGNATADRGLNTSKHPEPTSPHMAAPSSPRSRSQGINAVERALSILDLFIGGAPSLGLAELAKGSGLVKPTVLRCLASLEHCGYIVRTREGRYQLAAKALQLGASYQASFRLEEHILPVLQDLAETTRESASFQVREDGIRLCLLRVDSPQAVRAHVPAAVVLPIDSSSIGRVLSDDLADVAARNYRAVYSTAGVRDSETGSVATAVHGASGETVGALTVTGPIRRFTVARKRHALEPLAAAADRLSVLLGSPPGLIGRPPRLIQREEPDMRAAAQPPARRGSL